MLPPDEEENEEVARVRNRPRPHDIGDQRQGNGERGRDGVEGQVIRG